MLSFDPWTWVWNIINIIVLYLLFKHFLYKPMTKFLKDRSEKIKKMQEDARLDREEAERIKKELENSLKETKEKTQQLIKEAQDRANSVYDEIVARAREEAANIIEEGHKEALADRERMLKELKADIMDMVIDTTYKVMAVKLNQEEDKKLINNILEEVMSNEG
ncbi:MAG: F0F1 ATP synthase subunit B [Thermoanaerobacteraceae bacterium]|nr:F0F1 ATP synthase subunit B [Thermoanaerobacteraceae bacterium]